jgi:dephospho-CoA kinase
MSTEYHPLIGLSGWPRSGKDTVANILEKEFPDFYRTNFSKVITEEYDALHGTNTRNDEEEKVRNRGGISAMTHARRLVDPEYYVKLTLVHPGPMLVAGVRHEAEAEAIRRLHGVLIRVEVSEETLRQRMGEHYEAHARHAVETHLDHYKHWDYVISNDGSLEELEQQVHEVARELRAGFAAQQAA